MIPYAIQMKDIKPDHLCLFDHICSLVKTLPNDWTCHQVAGHLYNQINGDDTKKLILLVKGKFAGADHSWLVIAGTLVIIDPYPWATGSGPLILTTQGVMNPWRKVYDPCP